MYILAGIWRVTIPAEDICPAGYDFNATVFADIICEVIGAKTFVTQHRHKLFASEDHKNFLSLELREMNIEAKYGN